MQSHFRRLLPMLLLIFIDSFSFFVVIPVLLKILYHAHYGLLPTSTSLATRNTLTGMIISLSMFAALIFAPLIGRASDKYGRKKTLLCCTGFVFAGFLLPIIGIIQKSIAWIVVGRLLSGIGSASQPVAQAAVADLCQDDNKAIYLSFIAIMMTLALIVGPLAGGLLSNHQLDVLFHVTTPFEFALALSIINFLLILFFFRETMHSHDRINTIGLKDTLVGLPALIKQHHVGTAVVLFFCLELGWSQYYQSIDLFLQQSLHFSVDHISLFSSMMGITMAVGLLIIYPILLRFFSLTAVLRNSIVLTCIGAAACALLPYTWSQWIFSSLLALCTGFSYVSLVAVMSNKVSHDKQGLLMGYLSTILYCAWMLTALSSGILVSVHAALPLYCAAGFLIIGLVNYYVRNQR